MNYDRLFYEFASSLPTKMGSNNIRRPSMVVSDIAFYCTHIVIDEAYVGSALSNSLLSFYSDFVGLFSQFLQSHFILKFS